MRRLPTAGLLGRPLTAAERANAPETLHTDGPMRIPLPPLRVSVIGTRGPTSEGAAEARDVSHALARSGVTVVSGLASGIDTIAHRAAIDAGGRTIAVLGTPLDSAYPASNTGLQNRIRESHMIVSQFAPWSVVTRKNFVLRNHTMALLSDAAVIVEAGERSGTVHHARETLRLGRRLFIGKTAAKDMPDWLGMLERVGAERLDGYSTILDALPPAGS